jgi:hypothetical protein
MLEELNKRSGAITIDRDIVEHFQSKKDYMDYLNESVLGNFTDEIYAGNVKGGDDDYVASIFVPRLTGNDRRLRARNSMNSLLRPLAWMLPSMV